MSEIDQVEFGKVVQRLDDAVKVLDATVKRVDCMSQQMIRGKGVLLGICMAAGGIGAGATHALEKLLK